MSILDGGNSGEVRTGGIMSKIAFDSVERTFTILNPQADFKEETHCVVVRRDPLLGDTSVYNPFLENKARAFFGENDVALIEKLAQESAKTCVFCGDRIEKSTPRYPTELIPSGRIRVDEALLFPNLFSIGQYHAVVALCRAHFLKLSAYEPILIENGLMATQQFLKSVYARDESALFTTVNANYLFPAGASLVHPHLQMIITPLAYSYHARMLEACRNYYGTNGSAYHSDLIAEEKKTGVRYIADRGRWSWLTAYSPMGSNEIMAVHQEESDFVRMDTDDLRELAYGISKVLALYESLGHLSFNYTIFSVRQPHHRQGFRCLLKIVNRQNLYANYRNDDYYLQKMLQTELIINLPENLAGKMRSMF